MAGAGATWATFQKSFKLCAQKRENYATTWIQAPLTASTNTHEDTHTHIDTQAETTFVGKVLPTAASAFSENSWVQSVRTLKISFKRKTFILQIRVAGRRQQAVGSTHSSSQHAARSVLWFRPTTHPLRCIQQINSVCLAHRVAAVCTFAPLLQLQEICLISFKCSKCNTLVSFCHGLLRLLLVFLGGRQRAGLTLAARGTAQMQW